MTLPTLLAAERIVFLVTGAAKADAVERALRRRDRRGCPASLLRAGEAPIEVFCDRGRPRDLD